MKITYDPAKCQTAIDERGIHFADAALGLPLREPFTVFAQGGTHHEHWAIVLEEAVEAMGLGEVRVLQR